MGLKGQKKLLPFVAHYHPSMVKVKSFSGQVVHAAGAYYFGFHSMKRLRVSLLPPRWDASLSRGYPPEVSVSGTHFYTWVEGDNVE